MVKAPVVGLLIAAGFGVLASMLGGSKEKKAAAGPPAGPPGAPPSGPPGAKPATGDGGAPAAQVVTTQWQEYVAAAIATGDPVRMRAVAQELANNNMPDAAAELVSYANTLDSGVDVTPVVYTTPPAGGGSVVPPNGKPPETHYTPPPGADPDTWGPDNFAKLMASNDVDLLRRAASGYKDVGKYDQEHKLESRIATLTAAPPPPPPPPDEHKPPAVQPATPATPPEVPHVTVTAKGPLSTLWGIANAYTGQGNRYPELVKANQDKVPKPDKNVWVGEHLRLPSSWPTHPIVAIAGGLDPDALGVHGDERARQMLIAGGSVLEGGPADIPIVANIAGKAGKEEAALTAECIRAGALALHLKQRGKGREDREHVRKFQKHEGIPETGKYDIATARSLAKYGIVPPTPFYWPAENAHAQMKAYRETLEAHGKHEQNPQRSKVWTDAAKRVKV
jgi:hypothetical protein